MKTLRLFLLYALILGLTIFGIVYLASCGSLRASGGVKLPVVAGMELVDPATGKPDGFVLTNTRRTLAYWPRQGRVFLVDSSTRLTLAELRFESENQIVLIDRDRDVDERYPAGTVLPLWVTSDNFVTPAELARWGLTVNTPTP